MIKLSRRREGGELKLNAELAKSVLYKSYPNRDYPDGLLIDIVKALRNQWNDGYDACLDKFCPRHSANDN